jgi:hypothetical protein
MFLVVVNHTATQEITKSNSPYAIETLATVDVETEPILREHWGRQPLGEDVGELGGRQDMEDTNISDGNTLANEVEINLNMLGTLIMDEIGRGVDCAGVVGVD